MGASADVSAISRMHFQTASVLQAQNRLGIHMCAMQMPQHVNLLAALQDEAHQRVHGAPAGRRRV